MVSSEILENIHKSIMIKINIIKNISKILNLKIIYDKINKIYDIYLIEVIDVIVDYYKNYIDVKNIFKCTSLYKNRISNINIINKIDIIYHKLHCYIINNKIENDKVKIDMFNYNNITIYTPEEQYIDDNLLYSCDCKNEKRIDISNSELVCPTCGKIYSVNTTYINYNNNDDKQTTKYDFLRHYRIWLDKILANGNKYNVKYNKDIKFLEKKIYEDYPLEQQRNKLNINHIRLYLKNLNLTKLNDIVPILLKKITKNDTPQLTAKEYFDLENLFIQVMKCYDTIKSKSHINRRFYPFYIFKIIEYYFRNNPEKKNY